MRNLTDFLKIQDIVNVSEGSNIQDRRKEILNILKGIGYEDYVDKLNTMCDDPKFKALIDDAFGGELGNVQLKVAHKKIAAAQLMPTQNEIDTTKSLSWYLKKPEQAGNLFNEPITLGIPLVTFNSTWIIDGHHRWSQVACYNPDAEMSCVDFSAPISPVQMLKAMQGAIAAELGEIPVCVVTGMNIYDMKRKDAVKFFEDNMSDEAYEAFSKYYSECKTKEELISHLADNVMALQTDHPLQTWAPKRNFMPQTDKAEQALERIAKDKVLKVPGKK